MSITPIGLNPSSFAAIPPGVDVFKQIRADFLKDIRANPVAKGLLIGSGPGQVNNNPAINIYTTNNTNQNRLIQELLANNVISTVPGQSHYTYKGVPVDFKVIGSVFVPKAPGISP